MASPGPKPISKTLSRLRISNSDTAQAFRRRFAEMDGSQLGHELSPQLRAVGCEQFCAHPQPPRGRAVAQRPLAELCEDGHQLNRRLGQAVGSPPPGPRLLAGQQAAVHQPLQPVRDGLGAPILSPRNVLMDAALRTAIVT